MTGKAIPNYEKKYDHLMEYQDGCCAITDLPFDGTPEVHHLLAETRVNCKLFPQLIHSVWNLRLVDHDAHMSKPLPERLPLHVAEKVEAHLAQNPDVAALVNMSLPAWHSVTETQNLLDVLLDEVWPERRTA